MQEYPEQRLKNKVILITGAASGIGRASAIRMAKEGATIIVNDINQANIDETMNTIKAFGGTAFGICADVSKKEQVDAMIEAVHEKYGRISMLFANAGIADYQKFIRTSENFWDHMFEVNTKGVFLVTQAVVKNMLKYEVPEDQLRGKIIITASRAGKDGLPEMTAYSASKGALLSLTVALAKELGPKRITVNAICPGVIKTPIYGNVSKEQLAGIDGPVALQYKPVGDPEDVANLVTFLAASPDSDYITGQAINIDGGSIFH